MWSSQPWAPLKYSWLPVTYTRARPARTSPSGAACSRASDLTVGDVAGVADDVGVERVDAVDDPGRPAGPVDRARSACRSAAPPAARPGPRPSRGDRRRRPCRSGAPASPRRCPTTSSATDDGDDRAATTRDRAGSATPAATRDQPQHVAQQRPDEQHPDHAEQGVPGDGGPVAVPAAVARASSARATRPGRRRTARCRRRRRRSATGCRPPQRPPGTPNSRQHDGDTTAVRRHRRRPAVVGVRLLRLLRPGCRSWHLDRLVRSVDLSRRYRRPPPIDGGR